MVQSHPLSVFFFSALHSLLERANLTNTLLLREVGSKEEEKNLDEIKEREGETEQGPVVNTDYSLPT